MRDYVFQLEGGTSSVFSPEQRYSVAKAQLDADDAANAKTPGTVDFSDYKSAADAFLAESRDANGSTLAYFADLQRVTNAVNSDIASTTASITAPDLDLSPVTNAVNDQTTAVTALLSQISTRIATLNGNTSSVATASYAVSLSDPRYIGLN